MLSDSQAKTAKKVAKFLVTAMHSQVVVEPETLSMLGLKQSKQRLEYLQLGIQKPKALLSFEPLIDDEFLFTERELKLRNRDTEETPKELKRKIKAQEKSAAREIKKDTQTLMIEKRN